MVRHGTDSIDDENTGYKINAMKCPYHNARAAPEVFERVQIWMQRRGEACSCA
jgi:hypothetical protein